MSRNFFVVPALCVLIAGLLALLLISQQNGVETLWNVAESGDSNFNQETRFPDALSGSGSGQHQTGKSVVISYWHESDIAQPNPWLPYIESLLILVVLIAIFVVVVARRRGVI